jgi:hypothetical protein
MSSQQGGCYTHTSLGAPYGSYNVPSILYDDFMDIYCEALSTKVYPLHLTEAYTVLSHPRRFGLPFSTDEGENRRFDDNS